VTKPDSNLLPIGAIADRTGVAVSAIRFYEDQGLISSTRGESGHRRFDRATIRRLSFVRICQQLGYSLDEIRTQLDSLPEGRAPTEKDWERLASGFASDIDRRIDGLRQLKEKLDGCIGCGCLSLQRCALYNPDDTAARLGQGPRYLLGDTPP
jgi:MerR family transcriptional regulator, redox-sensitive transcriptional activator SoxR